MFAIPNMVHATTKFEVILAYQQVVSAENSMQNETD